MINDLLPVLNNRCNSLNKEVLPQHSVYLLRQVQRPALIFLLGDSYQRMPSDCTTYFTLNACITFCRIRETWLPWVDNGTDFCLRFIEISVETYFLQSKQWDGQAVKRNNAMTFLERSYTSLTLYEYPTIAVCPTMLHLLLRTLRQDALTHL